MTVSKSLDGWSLVLVGSWNPAILNPEWIGRNMFGQDAPGEVDVRFQIGRVGCEFGFVDAGVDIAVDPGKVLVRPRDEEDATLDRCNLALTRLLRCLAHTPVKAAGINLAFEVEDYSPAFGTELDVTDSVVLDVFGGDFLGVTRRYALRIGETWPRLNLQIAQSPDSPSIRIECNFHFERGEMSLGDLADRLDGKFKEAEQYTRTHLARFVEVQNA